MEIQRKQAVKMKSDYTYYQLCLNMSPSRRKTTLIVLGVLLVGITVVTICELAFQQLSFRVAMRTYRWYKTSQDCLKATSEQGELVDLAERAKKAMRTLGIPAPVCYGTLWGVLRYNDLLPWDNNVDFCVMNEYVSKVSFSDMQKTFTDEGLFLEDFSYSSGSYRMQRGSADGYINVFVNCTHAVPIFYPSLIIRALSGYEKSHWACALSVASVIGKYTHDFNRPLPTWLLTPPFAQKALAYSQVDVPHDSFEIQKYLYPDDWWMEVKPLGCL